VTRITLTEKFQVLFRFGRLQLSHLPGCPGSTFHPLSRPTRVVGCRHGWGSCEHPPWGDLMGLF